MWWYDPEEETRNRECREMHRFRQLATEAILAFLTEATTSEQYDQALLSLQALRDECIGRLNAFHRSPLYGTHRCIAEASEDLATRIRNAMVLRPVPQPAPEPEPPPPAPPPKHRSLTDVLKELGGTPDADKGE